MHGDRGPHLGSDLPTLEREVSPPPASPKSRGPGTSLLCSGGRGPLTGRFSLVRRSADVPTEPPSQPGNQTPHASPPQ